MAGEELAHLVGLLQGLRFVFSAFEAKETKVPAECSLLSSIQAVRELIDEKRLRHLY